MYRQGLPGLLILMTLFACGPAEEGTETPSGTATPTATATAEPVNLLCTDPTAVSCEDQMILDLGLNDFVSEGAITTTQEDGYFLTEVDATAGGFQSAVENPWVYMRFTANGTEKVEVDDFDALDSMDWDVAFKRYMVRLNSGDAGPSCVSSAPVDGDFESIDALPSGVELETESFYSESCELIADDKGLGSADVSLGSWWGYNGCVTTSGQVFVIELNNGEHLKLVIDSYYAEGQDDCNETGSMGSGSANLSLRWAYLQ